MHTAHPRSRGTRIAPALVAVAALAAAGCSLSVGPGKMPTVAQIVVQGSSPVALKLIVSTDFYEVQDPTSGGIAEVYNAADTTDINLPYEASVDLTSTGAISIRLTNPTAQSASVHLQITLDSGPGYDHTGTIANGQELKYIYVYNQPLFQ